MKLWQRTLCTSWERARYYKQERRRRGPPGCVGMVGSGR